MGFYYISAVSLGERDSGIELSLTLKTEDSWDLRVRGSVEENY